jgi:hypothetical protein
LAKQLTKYDPALEEKQRFQIAVRDYVACECANIDFDDLIIDGTVVPYKPDGKKAYKVYL